MKPETHLAPWNVSWILHVLSRKENLWILCENVIIYSETIRNNQINDKSTAGCNTIYNVLTQREHDRCRLSPRPLPVTPQMAAGNHHLRPYRGPQFPNGNSKRKIIICHAAPCTAHKAENSSTTHCDCSKWQPEVSTNKVLELFGFYTLYIKNVKKRRQ